MLDSRQIDPSWRCQCNCRRFETNGLGLLYGPMAEQWIIRVDGKDYGPADLSMLVEWKQEGRLLPTNDVRIASQAHWQKAENIAGLFEAEPPPLQQKQPAAAPRFTPRADGKGLVAETFAFYTRG